MGPSCFVEDNVEELKMLVELFDIEVEFDSFDFSSGDFSQVDSLGGEDCCRACGGRSFREIADDVSSLIVNKIGFVSDIPQVLIELSLIGTDNGLN